MATTLELATELQRSGKLGQQGQRETIRIMRTSGVRRQCLKMNIGVARFAFNPVQIMCLPKSTTPTDLWRKGNVTRLCRWRIASATSCT